MPRTCTLKGKPFTLEGLELKPGDKAPDAALKSSLVESLRLADTHGKTRIFSVVPSLDTPVCAQQTKRFNEEAAKLANVDFYTISCDLPTAQARFCGAESINKDRLKTLSDHFDTSFGRAYGTLIRELRVECRAVFVVDSGGTIRYAEYVPEVANHPNYEAVLTCAKQLAGTGR
jgi:thiol peroxidase